MVGVRQASLRHASSALVVRKIERDKGSTKQFALKSHSNSLLFLGRSALGRPKTIVVLTTTASAFLRATTSVSNPYGAQIGLFFEKEVRAFRGYLAAF
jgi:hypothetical protein